MPKSLGSVLITIKPKQKQTNNHKTTTAAAAEYLRPASLVDSWVAHAICPYKEFIKELLTQRTCYVSETDRKE